MHAATTLRTLFKRPGIIKVGGAHDALSAKIAQEVGFDAVWAGGFSISASLKCIPDASFITLTEQISIERNMAEIISIPIVADCDTGYGNALNVIRTVNDHERAGIAAICIEDNVFPKRCSFYAGVRRELISIEEHCGKIRAAKSSQLIPDFMVIARTEALIAGWGKEEALKRVQAYADAGADAVLIHSKTRTFDELREVAQACPPGLPLVAVPTTYDGVTATELEAAGFKMVIYANQAIRSAIRAMRETLTTILQEGNAESVNASIVPLQEVYDLVGVSTMKANEKEFLPAGGEPVTALIAAAGYEKTMLPLIQDRPKCLLDIKGKSILERQVGSLNECNIKDITVIRGYQKEAITLPNIRYYDNDRYEDTGDLFSFFCAEPEIHGRCIFLYGDIIFDTPILQKLLKSPADITLVVDFSWRDSQQTHGHPSSSPPDLVHLETAPGNSYRYVAPEDSYRVLKIGQSLSPDTAHGEFIGMMMCSTEGTQKFKDLYREIASQPQAIMHESPSFHKASLTDIIQLLINRGESVQCVPIYKGWMDVDSFEDYQKAWVDLAR